MPPQSDACATGPDPVSELASNPNPYILNPNPNSHPTSGGTRTPQVPHSVSHPAGCSAIVLLARVWRRWRRRSRGCGKLVATLAGGSSVIVLT